MEWRGKEPSLHINFLLSQSRKTIFPELSNRLSLSVHRQSWVMYPYLRGFSGGSAGKESACNERPEFSPWVGKTPWRRDWLPTPVFWPGEFHELHSPWGHKESDMTE